MKDYEVGKRWLESLDDVKRPYGTIGKDIVQALIRKLVEERRHRSKLDDALYDFGIPPETWE